MKSFKSILCASLLTLAMSSAALAGNISGRDGNISGAPTASVSKDGNISGIYGNISGLTDVVYDTLLGFVGTILG